jgi:hypothetical protein
VLDPLEGTNCNYWADHVCIMKIIYINTWDKASSKGVCS